MYTMENGKGSIRGQKTTNFCPRILNFQEKFRGMFFSKIQGYFKFVILLPRILQIIAFLRKFGGIWNLLFFLPNFPF